MPSLLFIAYAYTTHMFSLLKAEMVNVNGNKMCISDDQMAVGNTVSDNNVLNIR